jgi:hypothetical protein
VVDTAKNGSNSFTLTTLADVHTGELLATSMQFFHDDNEERSYGIIGDDMTTCKQAKAYIKRMTTE